MGGVFGKFGTMRSILSLFSFPIPSLPLVFLCVSPFLC